MYKNIYLALALLGIIIPYSQFVPWTMANGLNFGLMFEEMFVNQISRGITFDALLVAVVIIAFVFIENKKRSVKNLWLPIIGIFLFGVSFALPMYLYLREKSN